MTEVKISYNNEEYTLEELLQKLSSSEEKIKELQSKVNAYVMADAINTIHKKYEEECVRKLINENLNKCCYDFSSYKKVSDASDQKEIEEMKRAINSLKENISLREENIRLKKQIDKLEEEKSAIAWMGVILALMKNNEPMGK
jgi:hypothetical protein